MCQPAALSMAFSRGDCGGQSRQHYGVESQILFHRLLISLAHPGPENLAPYYTLPRLKHDAFPPPWRCRPIANNRTRRRHGSKTLELALGSTRAMTVPTLTTASSGK